MSQPRSRHRPAHHRLNHLNQPREQVDARFGELVTGLFALAGAALLAPRKLPQPLRDEHHEQHRVALDLLRLPRVRSGVLMSVALFMPVGFYDATLDVYLTDRGASDVLIGLTFLAYGIPFAMLATAGGRLSDHRGAVRVAFVSTVLVGPLTAAYGLISVPLVILALTVNIVASPHG